MAGLTLTGLGAQFPDGTTVYVYEDVGLTPGDYRPAGTAAATGTVAGHAVTFSGLVEGTSYWVVGQVAGAWRWVRAYVQHDPELPGPGEFVLGEDLQRHIDDTTDVHGAADVEDLQTSAEVAAVVAAHGADTTSVHGIADTAALETASGAQSKVDAHAADTSSVHGVGDFRRVAVMEEAPLNPQWPEYGAVGGSSAADAAGIQAAFAAAAAAPGRGHVYIPPPGGGASTYLMSAPLTINDDRVEVFGAGLASSLNRASGYPAGEPMIKALGRQGIVIRDLKLVGGDLAQVGVALSGPTLGNPHNRVADCFISNFISKGVQLGEVGVQSFSGKVIGCEIGMTDSGSSVGIENNNPDNTIVDNKITGYSVAALKITAGIPKCRNNEYGPAALRTGAPYPNAVQVINGGLHSVDDYFDWNRQAHLVLVQPGGGQTVTMVTVESAKCVFDSLAGDGSTAADAAYDFVRLDDASGTIEQALIKGCAGLGGSSARRLKSLVYVGSTAIEVELEGNCFKYVQSVYNGTGGGTPAGRRSNHIHDGTGWARSSRQFAATATGDGVATAFTFAHGMRLVPSNVRAEPRNQASAAAHWVSAVDATNVTITYAAAPAGAASLSYYFQAEV